jgi:hypothetical protein
MPVIFAMQPPNVVMRSVPPYSHVLQVAMQPADARQLR